MDGAPSGDEVERTLVRLGDFRRGSVASTLRVHAVLEAVERAEVYPEISGIVEQVLAREGDRVERGQLIVKLRDAEHDLTSRSKKVLWDQAVSRVELAKLSADEMDETVRSRELAAEKAKAEFDRVHELFTADDSNVEGVISKEDYDVKRYAWKEAQIAHETARIQQRKAELDHTLAKQTAEQAELDYRTAELQLARTRLVSPIDGAVTFLELKRGELVGSSKMAFRVHNPSRLEARLFVPQKELEGVRVGQEVRIRTEVQFEGFEDRTFRGRVDVVNPVVDTDSGMVRLIVAIDDPEAVDLLRPGLFINGEIVLETRDDVPLVDRRVLLYENQLPVLYLVEDGVARRYVVDAGFSSSAGVEVRGLVGEDGRRLEAIPERGALVVMGQNNLKDGKPVKVSDLDVDELFDRGDADETATGEADAAGAETPETTPTAEDRTASPEPGAPGSSSGSTDSTPGATASEGAPEGA